MLLEQHRLGHFSLELIVEKAAHNPALRYHVQDRGFLREGYFADMVAVDLEGETSVTEDQLLYMCGWSPLEGTRFGSRVSLTFVNGSVVSRNGRIEGIPHGKALTFSAE
jgi:dihydroorotase